VGGDRNGNGYTELSACFRKEDLRQLFSEVTGTQQVQVTFEGNLLVGGRTCSSLTITVKGGGGAVLAASISPNPLNPSAVLTFSTQERGPVLVQLFDVRGRLLRTLRDEADAAAGYHDVRIDGTTANGTRLSSGIYYIRIRAGAEEERRTITILK
jgi:flagellar hook assembly protein FlgD